MLWRMCGDWGKLKASGDLRGTSDILLINYTNQGFGQFSLCVCAIKTGIPLWVCDNLFSRNWGAAHQLSRRQCFLYVTMRKKVQWTLAQLKVYVLLRSTGVCWQKFSVGEIYLLDGGRMFLRYMFDMNKGKMLEWGCLELPTSGD